MPKDIITISADEYYKLGCPHCHYIPSNSNEPIVGSVTLMCPNPKCIKKFRVFVKDANGFYTIGNKAKKESPVQEEDIYEKLIVISDTDYMDYGCPRCGEHYSNYVNQREPEGPANESICNSCGKKFIVSKFEEVRIKNICYKLSKHPLSKNGSRKNK